MYIGEHDTTRYDGEEKIRVSGFTTHPSYNLQTTDNDFAIIQLVRAVKFSPTIMPVCLPSPNNNKYDSVVATVAGWGGTEVAYISPTPNKVDVNTMTNSACTSNTAYQPGQITSNMICAALPGKDACQGRHISVLL